MGTESRIQISKTTVSSSPFSSIPLLYSTAQKLTLEARDSILTSPSSKCFEFQDATIESRDARIDSRVSLIKDPGLRKLRFPKERCCTVT